MGCGVGFFDDSRVNNRMPNVCEEKESCTSSCKSNNRWDMSWMPGLKAALYGMDQTLTHAFDIALMATLFLPLLLLRWQQGVFLPSSKLGPGKC
jgi:hypothetical protein